MNTRLKNLILYLKNTRLESYEEILIKAQKKGYEVISLRDYIDNNFTKSSKLLILRHDIDHFSDATKKMFELEKKHNVRSSFYFRNCTFEPKLMKEIETYGSEASLHFEPVADFIKANPSIKTKEDLFKTDFQTRCLSILKANLERFRLLCDLPCTTIASHGEYENSLVQTPNNFLTEDIKTYKELGIKLEAYNKEMIDKVTCYISDVPIEINGGYKYGTTPLEAIKRDESFILFLSHPNHWQYSKWQQLKKLIKMIIVKPIDKKMSFHRI